MSGGFTHIGSITAITIVFIYHTGSQGIRHLVFESEKTIDIEIIIVIICKNRKIEKLLLPYIIRY